VIAELVVAVVLVAVVGAVMHRDLGLWPTYVVASLCGASLWPWKLHEDVTAAVIALAGAVILVMLIVHFVREAHRILATPKGRP
jgi:hypothetical protein